MPIQALHLFLRINTWLAIAWFIVFILMMMSGPGGGLIVFAFVFTPLTGLLALSVFIATFLFLASMVTEGETIAIWKGVLLCLAALALGALIVMFGGPVIKSWF